MLILSQAEGYKIDKKKTNIINFYFNVKFAFYKFAIAQLLEYLRYSPLKIVVLNQSITSINIFVNSPNLCF